MALPSLTQATVPELWILRHGETEWNAAGRLQGWLDSPLTEKGHAQALAQAVILKAAGLPEECRVLSSIAGRALETAEIATSFMNKPIEPEPMLVEVGMGVWQGKTLAEIKAAEPTLDTDSDPQLWKFTGERCESLFEMVLRVKRVVTTLTGPTVIVTHGITSRILRCLVLGLDPRELTKLPGGQGNVHHIKDGVARILTPPAS